MEELRACMCYCFFALRDLGGHASAVADEMSKCFKDTHPPFTVAPTQNVTFRIATPLLQKLRRAGGGGQVTRPLPSVLYSTASFLLLHSAASVCRT